MHIRAVNLFQLSGFPFDLLNSGMQHQSFCSPTSLSSVTQQLIGYPAKPAGTQDYVVFSDNFPLAFFFTSNLNQPDINKQKMEAFDNVFFSRPDGIR